MSASSLLMTAGESGLVDFTHMFGFPNTTWGSLKNTFTDWWDGAGGSLGAKTYVGAVGAGLAADGKAIYHVSQAAVNVGGAVTTALTTSYGPWLVLALVIVIIVIAIKVT